MQLEAVIFDFDGVILDSESIHYEACISALQAIGISFSYAEYSEKYIGLSDKEMFPQILFEAGQKLSPLEVHQLIENKIRIYTELINTSFSLPFVQGLFDYIMYLAKERKKMAICSGSTSKEVLTVLFRAKEKMLKDYFQVIVTSEQVKNGKPSPEGYLLTAKSLNLSPQKCMAIEDSSHGIKAAKMAGMYVIALETTHDRKYLQEADEIVQDFTCLLNDKS